MASFLDSLAAGQTLDGFDPEETELLLRAAVELLPQEPAMRVAEWLDGATSSSGGDQFDPLDFDFGAGSDELAVHEHADWLTEFGESADASSNPLDDDDDMGEWDKSWTIPHIDAEHGHDDLVDAHHHDAGDGHQDDLSDLLDLTGDHGPGHHED